MKNLLALQMIVTLLSKILINELCRKDIVKPHALTTSVNFMGTGKRHSILQVFIIPQFNFCTLV